MKRLKLMTWMVVIAMLLASCANGETPTDTSSAYPAANAVVPTVNFPYPAQNVGQSAPTAIPAHITLRPPAAGKANIHGILTVGPNSQPDVNYLLLAKAFGDPAHPESAPMLHYFEGTSPRAQQDQTGAFVFFDVDPGQYGLVISNGLGGSTILDPSLNPPQQLIFTVKADEDKDLGTLNTP